MRRIVSTVAVLLASTAPIVIASPALAQAQPTQPTQPAPQDAVPAAAVPQQSQVEDIVVTAQRREESAQKVPISISAVSSTTLAAQHIENPSDLGAFVPGLNITRANVASVPFVRGVGNFTATPGNEAAIATYVDDVYYASPAASTFTFNNIARVEVLKGPQGTLFGRNAAGGVINVVTRDPTQETTVDADFSYGNYDYVEGNLYASTGLTENLAADIAVHFDDQNDGWGKNLTTGKDAYLANSFSVRSKWIWQIAPDWRLRVIGDYSNTRNDQSVVLSILPGTIQSLGYVHKGGFFDTIQDFPSDGHQTQYGGSARIDHDMGWATIASITAWRRSTGIGYSDSDAGPTPKQTAEFNPIQTTLTQELQIASPNSSPVKWIAGFYYFDDNAGIDPLIQTVFPTYTNGIRYLSDAQQTYSYAGYAQATVPIFTNTKLTGGIRYTLDDRSITGRFYDINNVTQSTANQSDHWSRVTYRAALDQQFTQNILGYVSYSRGFKSGNFNLNNPVSAAVKPETIDAYEIGLKSDLWDHRLRINAAAFYYDFKDLQVQQSIVGSTIQTNAATARYKGIDLDITLVPTSRFTLVASAEVLDAKYTKFENATFNYPCVGSTNPACATAVNGGGYYTAAGDASGLDIPYAEKFTATLAATYRIPTGIGDFNLAGNVAYHDGFYFDVQNTLLQPSFTLLNGSIEWRPTGSRFSLRLWIKNIGNVHYYAQQQVNALVATYSAQAPRTFGATLGFHL